MRELVYVSQSKLDRFDDSSMKRLFPRIGKVSTRVRVPFVELASDVEAVLSDRTVSGKRKRVLKDIQAHAVWYQDEHLIVGDWVAFEGRFHLVLGSMPGEAYESTGMVVFFEVVSGNKALLLHGSSTHLLGRTVPTRVGFFFAGSDLQPIWDYIRYLSREEECTSSADADPNDDVSQAPLPVLHEIIIKWVKRLHLKQEVDSTQANRPRKQRPYVLEYSAHLRGYARVTSVLAQKDVRLVTATPLVVERVNARKI